MMSEEIETPVETVSEPTPKPAKPQLPPDQLFAAFLKRHNLVAFGVVNAPDGGAVNVESFIERRLRDEGWRFVVQVAEAK